MKTTKFLIAALGLVAAVPYASAQNAQSPYAFEDCRSGCYLVKESGGNGATIYVGAVPRTFRICSADVHASTIVVDGKTLPVPGTSFGVRACQDINATNIVLARGTVAVGAVP